MARIDIRLDSAGLDAVLRSPEVRDTIRDLAESIADRVRAELPPGADVVVDDYMTQGMRSDRPASSVTIRDHRGRLWQVRDGVLTRAAAAEGLEVKERR